MSSHVWFVYVIVFGIVLPFIILINAVVFAYRRRQARLKRLAKLNMQNPPPTTIIYSNADPMQQPFYYMPPGSPAMMPEDGIYTSPIMYPPPTQPTTAPYKDPSPLPPYYSHSPNM